MFYLDLVIEVFVVSWVSLQGKFWEILELLWAMNGPLLLKILLKHQTASELIHQSNQRRYIDGKKHTEIFHIRYHQGTCLDCEAATGTSWFGSKGSSGVRFSNCSLLMRFSFLKFSTSCFMAVCLFSYSSIHRSCS